MNKIYNHFFFYPGLLFLLNSCTNSTSKTVPANKNAANTPIYSIKPPANYSDTLVINKPAAVFFYPDSLQLQKIESAMEKNIFESSMHEFFFQIRNARIVMNTNRPEIKIMEARNVRYLLFKKKNKEAIIIDLNTKNDPYGLFLFDTKKNPELVDMMNIDTELGFYFENK